MSLSFASFKAWLVPPTKGCHPDSAVLGMIQVVEARASGVNGPWGVWAGYSNSAQNSISAGQAEAAELSSKILALRFNLSVRCLCGPRLTIMAISVMGSLLKLFFLNSISVCLLFGQKPAI